jgi:lysozyme
MIGEEYTLGVDVSSWQPKVDWKVLYDGGVRFAIIKLSQGNYSYDRYTRDHVKGARDAGMLVGLYHWHDPLCNVLSQVDFIKNCLTGIEYDFFALDVEQYWADWEEWRKGYITKKLGAATISVSSHQLANEIKKVTGKKTMIYTRANFVKEYAPTMQVWLKDWDLWLAHYPYRPGRVSVSWKGLKEANLPSIKGPNLPPNCKEWKFWQFSGDKFVMPGVKTPLDLNFYNGSEKDLRLWLGLDQEVIEPVEYDYETMVKLLWNAHPELKKELVKT